MKRYRAEDLLAMSKDEIWNSLPEENHVVIFADGELESDREGTILSVALWYPFKKFPGCPIHKHNHAGDAFVTAGLINSLVNRAVWDIHAYSGETIDTELLSKSAIECVNELFNEFTVRAASYVTTLSLFDVLEVVEHPEIAAANAEVEPTTASIEGMAYPRIAKAFKDPHSMPGNPIAMGVKAGTLSTDQLVQGFGPRGSPTDINGDIFGTPILTGVVRGIWTAYGSLAESRSGTKALLYNKELLRATEYFNRKTQLIAQSVTNLHREDCGTPYYVDVPVLKGLLKHMAGKYYLKEDGTEDWIRGNEMHLVDKRIKMRSILGCIHPDPIGVCQRCYGRMAFSIPHGTNIGWASAVHIGDKITSKVLSTKHTDASANVDRFQLHQTEARYLKYGAEEETLYLRSTLRNRKLTLILEREEVQALADVLMIKDLSGYPVANASTLTKIGIRTETDRGPYTDVLNVSLYNRKASLSLEVLQYIQRHRWTLDERDNVVIDLSNFDVNKPFLVLPYKHVNMFEVMKRIQSFLHSGTEGEKMKFGRGGMGRTYLKNYRDPAEALVVFASMLNEKMSANFVHCETLVYAMMARNPQQKDFRLPVPGIHGTFEKYSRLMYEGSLSRAMAYERQHYPLNNPNSFINRERNDHPYDLVVMGGLLG